VDVTAARAVLGVGPDAPWAEVRSAYRATMRRTHPDLAGGATTAAAQANAAYAVLVRARARDSDAVEPVEVVETTSTVGPVEVLEGDTVHLALPADEAFVAVLEACHRIGDVTYVDRSCAILEALLPIEGEGVCSLVITFQGRADGTDAFCTLEAIEHVSSPPVHHVTAALADALRA
jgi:hypothetical protein